MPDILSGPWGNFVLWAIAVIALFIVFIGAAISGSLVVSWLDHHD